MYRQIFLLLFMATIMPWLVEAPNGGAPPMCYEGSTGASQANYRKAHCDNQNGEDEVKCFSFECSVDDSKPSLEVGCGPCAESEIPAGCKCTPCTGHLCNLPKEPPKCYEAPDKFASPKTTICPSAAGCFLVQCSSATFGSGSLMGCGPCPQSEIPAGCKCTPCKGNLCNQPEEPIKQCSAGEEGTPTGGFGKEDCKFYNNDGCKTIVGYDGRGIEVYEKSCGKCPEKEQLPQKKCFNCTKDLCNEKNEDIGPMKQCFVGKYGKFEKEDCKFYKTDGCHTIKCNGGKRAEDYEKGCGKCPAKEELDQGCECDDECTDGTLCNEKNKDIGPMKQCFVGKYGEFEKEDCKYFKTDGCQTIVCNGGMHVQDYHKFCEKCPAPGEERYYEIINQLGQDCKCTECTNGTLCNAIENKGSIKECYGGNLRQKFKFEKTTCKFFNNDACQTVECENPNGMERPEHISNKFDYLYQKTDIPSIEKSFGKCPTPEETEEFKRSFGIECKCNECTGDLCNTDKEKGTIKQCYVGDEGSYKEEDCKFYNNDGCHTIECGDDDKPDKKRCGKCPPPDEVENKFGSGCKCVECSEELCNKEVTVNQCYWGDDQKGYEAIDCKAPANTACKKVKCRDDNEFINPETGKHGFKHHRDCGKCSAKENKGDCRCFTCKDKDLCNDAMSIGSSSFVLMLAMIGGVVALLPMKPFLGIGV